MSCGFFHKNPSCVHKMLLQSIGTSCIIKVLLQQAEHEKEGEISKWFKQ